MHLSTVCYPCSKPCSRLQVVYYLGTKKSRSRSPAAFSGTKKSRSRSPAAFSGDQEEQESFAGSFLRDQEEHESFAGSFLRDQEEQESFAGSFLRDQEEQESLAGSFLRDQEEQESLAGSFLRDQEEQESLAGSFLRDQEEQESLAGSFLRDQEEQESFAGSLESLSQPMQRLAGHYAHHMLQPRMKHVLNDKPPKKIKVEERRRLRLSVLHGYYNMFYRGESTLQDSFDYKNSEIDESEIRTAKIWLIRARFLEGSVTNSSDGLLPSVISISNRGIAKVERKVIRPKDKKPNADIREKSIKTTESLNKKCIISQVVVHICKKGFDMISGWCGCAGLSCPSPTV